MIQMIPIYLLGMKNEISNSIHNKYTPSSGCNRMGGKKKPETSVIQTKCNQIDALGRVVTANSTILFPFISFIRFGHWQRYHFISISYEIF